MKEPLRSIAVAASKHIDSLEARIRNSINSPPVYRFILAQGLAVTGAALVGLIFGRVQGYSALLGGLVCWIPNSYFAVRTFRYRGARAAREIMTAVYRAEAIKLVMTAGLFFAVFYFVKPLHPISLFIAFISTQTVSWLASTLLTQNPKRNQ